MRKLVALLFIVVAVIVLGCGVEPSEELQVRWASAACAEHGGVDETKMIAIESEAEVDTTSVICRDGSTWIQKYNGPDAENEFETPLEVRARERGEPVE